MLIMFPACHTAPHLSYSDSCKVKWEKFSLNNAKEDILPLFIDFILDATTFRLVDTLFLFQNKMHEIHTFIHLFLISYKKKKVVVCDKHESSNEIW